MKLDMLMSQAQPISAGRPLVAADPPGGRRIPLLQQFKQCVVIVGLALLSYLFVSHFVVQYVRVVGSSMMPTLRDTEHYFLNRWVYNVRAPERGEVVVIKDPTDGSYAVKRIVAVSGDAVFIKNGIVYVNGTVLDETYLPPGTLTFMGQSVDGRLVTCGKGRYFVMGDNRNSSFDSRTYGPIPRENILGTIIR